MRIRRSFIDPLYHKKLLNYKALGIAPLASNLPNLNPFHFARPSSIR
jgi:hypothetical protein